MTDSTTIKPREVHSRDSATAILRKLGVKPPAYGLFIKQLDTGVWLVDLPRVYEQGYAVSGSAPVKAAPSAKTKKPEPKAAAPKPAKEKSAKPATVSCSSVAEGLILAGKTNAEVWAVIKDQFKLDDGKKGYPAWYRSRLRRQGKLKEETK